MIIGVVKVLVGLCTYSHIEVVTYLDDKVIYPSFEIIQFNRAQSNSTYFESRIMLIRNGLCATINFYVKVKLIVKVHNLLTFENKIVKT
jgi:hypothetical protein